MNLYHTEPTPGLQDCTITSSINRPKDVLGCPAAPEELSFTAFLAPFLFAVLVVCVCVCVCVRVLSGLRVFGAATGRLLPTERRLLASNMPFV